MSQNLTQHEVEYVKRVVTASRRAKMAIGIGFIIAGIIGILGLIMVQSSNMPVDSIESITIFLIFFILIFFLFSFLILRAKPFVFEPKPSEELTGVYHIRSFGGGKTRTLVDYIGETPITFQKHWKPLLTIGETVETRVYNTIAGEQIKTAVPQERAILLEIKGKADIHSEVELGLLNTKSNVFGAAGLILWVIALGLFGFSQFGKDKFIELSDLTLSFQVVFGGFWSLGDAFLVSCIYVTFIIVLLVFSVLGLRQKFKNDKIIKKIVASRESYRGL